MHGNVRTTTRQSRIDGGFLRGPTAPREYAHRFGRHLRDRYGDLVDQQHRVGFAAAVGATRARVLAEATLAFVVGFTLDDMGVMRLPAFGMGILLALLILAFGGVVHGSLLAARLHGQEPGRRDEALQRYRWTGRVVLLITAGLAVAWFVFFTTGVPPWVA